MLNSIKNKHFLKNVGTLLTGTTLAQLIPILITPILTRIYTPAEFGVLGLYISIISVLSVIITGRYDMAIMLPQKKDEAIDVLILSLIIAIITSSILFTVSLFFKFQLSAIFSDGDITEYLILVPLSLLFLGIYQSFNHWNNREKQYKRLATNRIFQSASLNGSQLFLGFMAGGVNGLVIGQVLGLVIASVRLVYLTVKGNLHFLLNFNFRNLKNVAIKYREFPLYSTWSSLFNVISLHLPVFLFTGNFTKTIVGYYTTSNKLLNLPMNILGNSVSQVFYQQAARFYEHNIHDLRRLTTKTLRSLLIIGLIPMGIIWGFGDILFKFFLGSKWELAGQYARLLSPSLLIVFCTSAITSLYLIYRKQRIYLMFDFLLLMARICGLVVGIFYFNSAVYAIALYSIFTIIARIAMLFNTIKMIKEKMIKVIKMMIVYFIFPFILLLMIRYYIVGSVY